MLEEEADSLRDVVLLTHPRNLDEPDVRNAARLARPGSRLFAVAVDGRGDVEFSEIRRDAPVRLSRFHVDLNRTAPPPAVRAAPPDARTPWRGDVGPTPYPFVFGVGGRGQFWFDFDLAGEWLVTATANGVLHATNTRGSGVEVLPRALIDGCLLTDVQQVRAVAGGVAVLGSVTDSPQGKRAVVAHYDFAQRTCTGYSLGWVHGSPWRWFYFRDLHSVAVVCSKQYRAVDLASGGRILAAGRAGRSTVAGGTGLRPGAGRTGPATGDYDNNQRRYFRFVARRNHGGKQRRIRGGLLSPYPTAGRCCRAASAIGGPMSRRDAGVPRSRSYSAIHVLLIV